MDFFCWWKVPGEGQWQRCGGLEDATVQGAKEITLIFCVMFHWEDIWQTCRKILFFRSTTNMLDFLSSFGGVHDKRINVPVSSGDCRSCGDVHLGVSAFR